MAGIQKARAKFAAAKRDREKTAERLSVRQDLRKAADAAEHLENVPEMADDDGAVMVATQTLANPGSIHTTNDALWPDQKGAAEKAWAATGATGRADADDVLAIEIEMREQPVLSAVRGLDAQLVAEGRHEFSGIRKPAPDVDLRGPRINPEKRAKGLDTLDL